MKILVINPGATSTKIAVFDEDQQLYKLGIDHSAEELNQFDRVIDQADYRKTAILDAITAAGYKLADFDAVCGRGGLYRHLRRQRQGHARRGDGSLRRASVQSGRVSGQEAGRHGGHPRFLR